MLESVKCKDGQWRLKFFRLGPTRYWSDPDTGDEFHCATKALCEKKRRDIEQQTEGFQTSESDKRRAAYIRNHKRRTHNQW